MKNEILYIDRKIRGMNCKEYAEFLGIPVNTYMSYENCHRTPRGKHSKTLMDKLGLKDGLVFFPNLYNDEEFNFIEQKINGKKVIERICIQMNIGSKSHYYEVYEASAIARAVRAESLSRRFKKININTKSNEGKKYINKEAARIANCLLNSKKITADDIALYKRCKIFEYENRTGKCIWGIPEAREYYGFDKESGEEIS